MLHMECAVWRGPVPLGLAGHGRDSTPGVMGSLGKVESLEPCGPNGGAFPTRWLSRFPQQMGSFLVRSRV